MGRKRKDQVLQKAIDEGRPIWPPLSDKTAVIRFIGYVPPAPKKYLLQTRYECWTQEGKTWCKWFNVKEADTEKELKVVMKEYKKNSVNPKMHLKDDFQIIINPKWTEEKD